MRVVLCSFMAMQSGSFLEARLSHYDHLVRVTGVVMTMGVVLCANKHVTKSINTGYSHQPDRSSMAAGHTKPDLHRATFADH